jgi:hypothetical protein
MAVLAQLLATLALVGHPAGRIPPGVRSIEIRSPGHIVRVADRGQIRRIEPWFDALRPTKAGLYDCPFIRAGSPTVRFAFQAENGSVLARASVLYAFKGISGPCNPVRFRVPEHRQKLLTGGRILLRVQRLLGVRFG